MSERKREELLRIENLSVEYKVKDGKLSAVNNVSFEVGKGEIFAIVGESGCGKSTIAHAITRLLMQGNETILGGIHFQGKDLNQLPRQEIEQIRGRHIGMVFQNPLDSLNPVYTTGYQIAEAVMLDGLDKKAAWEQAADYFRKVKMPDAERRVKSFPHELSGGMRQRVMIAMMLARSPELLIADEPTTALDVTIEAQILEIIQQLRNELGMAVMLITHNFGLVAEVADRIGVMYAGQMVEQGSVFEIFEKPMHPYTRMLMKALPRKTKKEGRLQTIDGSVPRLTEKKPGCRFANRCPLAVEVCATQNPSSRTVTGNHSYRCHSDKTETI